jgi:cyclic pyranopterin phosphate synthase
MVSEDKIMQENEDKLTHFNGQGRAQMVDVTEKAVTKRVATATAKVIMEPETLARIKEGKIKKGDVLAVAQTAGIMAAKRTSELIPMCHLLPLSGVDISFVDNGVNQLTVTATVKTTNQTGVEMEALTAVQIAALTVYDMCKAMDRGMVISDCHLVEKLGGKSGHFVYGE